MATFDVASSLVSQRGGWVGIAVRLFLTCIAGAAILSFVFSNPLKVEPIVYMLQDPPQTACSNYSDTQELIICNTSYDSQHMVDAFALVTSLVGWDSTWEHKRVLVAFLAMHALLILIAPWSPFRSTWRKHCYVATFFWLSLIVFSIPLYSAVVSPFQAISERFWVNKLEVDRYIRGMTIFPFLATHYLMLIWSSDWFLRRYLPGILVGRWSIPLNGLPNSLPIKAFRSPKDMLLVSSKEPKRYLLHVLDDYGDMMVLKTFDLNSEYQYTGKHRYETIVFQDRVLKPFPKLLLDSDERNIILLLRETTISAQKGRCRYQTLRINAHDIEASLSDANPINSQSCYKDTEILDSYYDVRQRALYVLYKERRRPTKICIVEYGPGQNKEMRFELENSSEAKGAKEANAELSSDSLAAPKVSLVVKSGEQVVVRTPNKLIRGELNRMEPLNGGKSRKRPIYRIKIEEVASLPKPYNSNMASTVEHTKCVTCVKHLEDEITTIHLFDDHKVSRKEPDKKIHYSMRQEHSCSIFGFSKSSGHLLSVTAGSSDVTIIEAPRLRGMWLPDLRPTINKQSGRLIHVFRH